MKILFSKSPFKMMRSTRNVLAVVIVLLSTLTRCSCEKTESVTSTDLCPSNDVDVRGDFMTEISEVSILDDDNNSLLSSDLAFIHRNASYDDFEANTVTERVTYSLNNGYYLGVSRNFSNGYLGDYRRLDVGDSDFFQGYLTVDLAVETFDFSNIDSCAVAMENRYSLYQYCPDFFSDSTLYESEGNGAIEITRTSENTYVLELANNFEEIGTIQVNMTFNTSYVEMVQSFPDLIKECNLITYDCLGDCSSDCPEGYSVVYDRCEDESCVLQCKDCTVIAEDGTEINTEGLSETEINALCYEGGTASQNQNLL